MSCGAGSLASYQASVLDETSGRFHISNLTTWDQGSSWPGGLLPGTVIASDTTVTFPTPGSGPAALEYSALNGFNNADPVAAIYG